MNILLSILFIFLSLSGHSQGLTQGYSKNDLRVQEIDREIYELEEMKRGYESRALRHENQAERLQFDDQTYLETRRHIELAEENRQKAAAVQRQIDQLQAERKTLRRSSK